MSLSMFVTVGSTLFPDLTDLVLSPAFLQLAADLGITELVVQYGAADLTIPSSAKSARMSSTAKGGPGAGAGQGEGSFEYSINNDKVDGAAGDASPNTGVGMIKVRFMRYTSEFDAEIRRADVVMSHAGSGSILSALRANKPLLVIPNNSLMDDHQSELARALQKEGYMAVSSINNLSADLAAFIERAQIHLGKSDSPDMDSTASAVRVGDGFTPFPPFARGRFASILDDVAGFSP